jgi:hypothetical protein
MSYNSSHMTHNSRLLHFSSTINTIFMTSNSIRDRIFNVSYSGSTAQSICTVLRRIERLLEQSRSQSRSQFVLHAFYSITLLLSCLICVYSSFQLHHTNATAMLLVLARVIVQVTLTNTGEQTYTLC